MKVPSSKTEYRVSHIIPHSFPSKYIRFVRWHLVLLLQNQQWEKSLQHKLWIFNQIWIHCGTADVLAVAKYLLYLLIWCVRLYDEHNKAVIIDNIPSCDIQQDARLLSHFFPCWIIRNITVTHSDKATVLFSNGTDIKVRLARRTDNI